MTKYIFITGGVISGLGKGVTAASVAATLIEMGYKKVTIRKIDPYLNVDPGVLSPYEHGEVFVTRDGMETDLDLGHYERFTQLPTTRKNATSFGKLMQSLLMRERTGDYLGKTVQLIPHFTDTIIDYIRADEEQYDFILCEVGGSAGDIEAMPFLEAVRQLRMQVGRARCMLLFLTYLIYYGPTAELKTKPTQDAVRRLLQAGLQPDVLVCRTEMPMDEGLRAKLALFTNVSQAHILQAVNTDDIYEVPLLLAKEGLPKVLEQHFSLPSVSTPAFTAWHQLHRLRRQATQKVKVGLIGKYVELKDAYYSLLTALTHAAWHVGKHVELIFINARKSAEAQRSLSTCDYILIPGGFGVQGAEAMLTLIQQARIAKKPTLGICLGMQLMVIEYARNVLGISNATSREFKKVGDAAGAVVIDLMADYKSKTMGGSMRLGYQEVVLKPASQAYKIYGKTHIKERHRHRYEVLPELVPRLDAAGLQVSGQEVNTGLPEIVELPTVPFYLGVQYHPEFEATPFTPHPLLMAWLNAAVPKVGA